MRDSAAALSAVATHFRLNMDVAATIESGVLSRHAKSGEPFDAARRSDQLAEVLRVHASEIEPVVAWATGIGEEAGIRPDLPYPLLNRA
jgi:hypothetical protein